MSHLKLQKLLYYIQALHLAYFESEIIADDFQAWLHGPVSRKIYDQLKGYSKLYTEVLYRQEPGEILPSIQIQDILTKDQIDLIDEIIQEYGKLTSSQLENLTHSESPWLEARKGYGPGDRCEAVISKETMKKFYKSELYGENKKTS